MSHNIQDFIQLIAQLRDKENGCPWDLAQDYQSMIPCLLEESYEVVDAIEKEQVDDLKEELGDLLLQVVFLSQLAREEGKFTFEDVVDNVSRKIIRRHPHVFGEKKAQNAEQALQNWNAVKADENQQKGHQSILDNTPLAFPALMRAQKLQKRCAKAGFDWQEIEPVFDKVEEELDEVRSEFQQFPQNPQKIAEEMGDLLFATVNLSRHLHCSAEESLRQANLKFERRFRLVEQKLKAQGKSLEQSSLLEMDVLWDEVKKEEKTK